MPRRLQFKNITYTKADRLSMEKIRDKDCLTPLQVAAINLLATDHTWLEVEHIIGIPATILGQWASIPAFSQEINNARRDILRPTKKRG
jgi:hypothetical protein